ncbi:hypothetical protein BC940DRAFT_334578 [Gongronella butleri]|nr:hypothetical protein BC940DRAFT_334578 [Gongronella butleri]
MTKNVSRLAFLALLAYFVCVVLAKNQNNKRDDADDDDDDDAAFYGAMGDLDDEFKYIGVDDKDLDDDVEDEAIGWKDGGKEGGWTGGEKEGWGDKGGWDKDGWKDKHKYPPPPPPPNSKIINYCNNNNTVSQTDQMLQSLYLSTYSALSNLTNENKGVENRLNSVISDVAETYQKLNDSVSIMYAINSSLNVVHELNSTLTELHALIGGLRGSVNGTVGSMNATQQSSSNSNPSVQNEVSSASNSTNRNELVNTYDNSKKIEQFTTCTLGCLLNSTSFMNETGKPEFNQSGAINFPHWDLAWQYERFNMSQLMYCFNNITIETLDFQNVTGCNSILNHTLLI